MKSKEFHTLPETARLLHASPPTIRSWVRQGLLPSPIAIGRKRLFKTSEVRRALAKLRAKQVG
jgi:excisionase family DNA binding protein